MENLNLEQLENINGGGRGKCIAGISGGAITAGTTWFLDGAAIGTVTLPGLGSVAGITVGGIDGAATFCFS